LCVSHNIFIYISIYSYRPCFASIDCGIRPATATEADWLQEYVRRSNNHAGLPAASLPVGRPSQGIQINQQQPGYTREGSRSDPDDEDDDGSEDASLNNDHAKGQNNASPQKQTSQNHVNGSSLSLKSPALYAMDISNKTPTTQSLQQQVSARPTASGDGSGAFAQTQAQIRRSLGPSQQSSQNHPFPSSASNAPSPASFLNGAGAAATQPISLRNLPNFPSIDDALGTNSSSPQGIIAREVWRWFEEHLVSLLESVRNFRFDQFEICLRTFWAGLSGDHREVVHAPAVAGLMARADALVYNVGRFRFYRLGLDTN
jgi:regulatory factor X